jgi:hypothetical protein
MYCKCTAMVDMGLVVLQNPTNSEKVLCSEECPASSDDTYPAIIIKEEVLSDAVEEKYPVPTTFVGIKGEPEVSCVSVSMLCDFRNTDIPVSSDWG